MDLDISTQRVGQACVVSLKGEVDVYTSPRLKQEIVDAIDSGCVNLVVDLRRLDFIDSSGLGVLVGGLRRVKEKGGTLRLLCDKESILKVFRITGLDRVFPVFDNAEAAQQF